MRLVGLALFSVVVAGCSGDDVVPKQNDTCTACGGDCLEETFTITDNHHTTDHVDYDTQPPVGGPHNPCWVPWAVYDRELQTERWVHNLEHGGVVVLYNCPAGCSDDVATLTAFVQAQPQGSAMLMPYAEMDSMFAAVSWGARITLGCVDTDALQAFYDAHLDHSPESIRSDPPPSCPAP